MHHSQDESESRRIMDEIRKETQTPQSEREDKFAKLDALCQQVKEQEHLGATGEFPEGKLTQHDEGEIRLAVTHKDGKVVLAFGRSISWIGFDPKQAREVAELLRQHSYKAAEPPEPNLTKGK